MLKSRRSRREKKATDCLKDSMLYSSSPSSHSVGQAGTIVNRYFHIDFGLSLVSHSKTLFLTENVQTEPVSIQLRAVSSPW